MATRCSDDYFGPNEADAVCRQLGYMVGVYYTHGSADINVPIWMASTGGQQGKGIWSWAVRTPGKTGYV